MTVAVVTGAASGIGAAVAAMLREQGWRVAGLDLRDSATDASYRVDVTDRAGVRDAVAAAEARLGRIEAVVTVAGYYEMRPVAELTRDQWDRMLRVILGGTLHAIVAVLPGLLERQRGRVVTISSELAIGGGAEDAHYAAAKGAVIGLTKALAVEVAPYGVLVNSVAPGPTDTPLLVADSPWRAPEYLATLPLRRLVRPEEVAATVGYLLAEGTFCCGEVLSPNAGAVI